MTQETEKGEQMVLYQYVAGKLAAGGLTKEEYEAIKDFPMGHSSVESFVRMNVEIGNLDWRGTFLVNADRKLNLKLTAGEEKRLREAAQLRGFSPREFATRLISLALDPKPSSRQLDYP